jgi:hypothetical protein
VTGFKGYSTKASSLRSEDETLFRGVVEQNQTSIAAYLYFPDFPNCCNRSRKLLAFIKSDTGLQEKWSFLIDGKERKPSS